jgi:hypothetical protein
MTLLAVLLKHHSDSWVLLPNCENVLESLFILKLNSMV